MKILLNIIAFGLSYQIFFIENLGLKAEVLYAPYRNYLIDNFHTEKTVNSLVPIFIRIIGNYKTGKNSNLSFGFWNAMGLLHGPWIGWEFLF